MIPPLYALAVALAVGALSLFAVRGDRAVYIAMIVPALAALGAAACTADQRRAVAPLVEPATRAGCTLLRARSDRAEEVCADAEEIAPLIRALLEARAQRDAGAPRQEPIVAFSADGLPASTPRFRCLAWRVDDAGAKEGGP